MGITIAAAEASNESTLWVYNRTMAIHKVLGRIAFAITQGNGRSSEVVILATRIPQDLTTMATKANILSSPEFRTLVSRGVVEIVTADKVAEVISTKDYQSEYNRINRITVNADARDNAAEAAEVMSEEVLNPHAMNVAAMKITDEEAAYSMLMNSIESYTVEDLQYVVNNSACPKVKTAAAARVLEM